jgi:L-lactate dehydrogenase
MAIKVGVVGAGFVGATSAYALVMQGVGRQVVLVDKNAKRARAEAEDITHAVPFARPLQISAGDYADLAESQVVVVAAGVGQKPGETRMQLLRRNAEVFANVIPEIVRAAPDAVLLIATNPVDVMTHVATHEAERAGGSAKRVLGSGTTLDTARFRSLLGRHFGVDSHHVHGHVVGEHGDSEVLTWSLATVGGMHLDEFAAAMKISLMEKDREEIDRQVRGAAYSIIEGKGATYYGIGAAVARIVNVLVHDQRAILTVCAPAAEIAGVKDVTVSLPRLVGGGGVLATLPLALSPEEQSALRASAATVREAIGSLG